MDYDQLIEQFEITSSVALNLREAAEALARNANGTRSHIMPTPTAYELLGHLKLALGHLNEVAAFLKACGTPWTTPTSPSPIETSKQGGPKPGGIHHPGPPGAEPTQCRTRRRSHLR